MKNVCCDKVELKSSRGDVRLMGCENLISWRKEFILNILTIMLSDTNLDFYRAACNADAV